MTTTSQSITRKIWFDTDAGTDDMTALLVIQQAIKQSIKTEDPWELVAISTVFGNVTLAQATENALICADVLDIDQTVKQSDDQSAKKFVPVFEGCRHSLLFDRPIETWVGHGSDGLGNADFGRSVDRSNSHSNTQCHHLTQRLQSKHAAQALIECVTEHPNEIDLVAVGPLTNIAMAIKLCPQLPKLVRSLCIMGGTIYGKGNVTLNAEFNFWCDPEAAHIVLAAWDRSDVEPILMVPIEPTEEFAFTWQEFDRMTRFGNIESDFLKRIYTACRKWSSAYLPKEEHTKHAITTPEREIALNDLSLSFKSHDDLAFPHSARHLMQPCDAYAVACLFDESVAQTTSVLYGQVILEGEQTRGGVIYDWHYFQSNRRDSHAAAHHALPDPKHHCNVKVVRHINRKRMYEMLEQACKADS